MNAEGLPIWAQILIAVGGAVGTAGLGLLAKALSKWADVLSAKLKIASIATFDDWVMTRVMNAWQTILRELKKALADGKITQEEFEKAQKTVKVDLVNDALEYFGVPHLKRMFGEKHVDAVGASIEKAVTIAKNKGKAARLPLA